MCRKCKVNPTLKSNSYCKDCNNERVKEYKRLNYLYCTECKRNRNRLHFVDDGLELRVCADCRDKREARYYQQNMPSMMYDYKFARTVLLKTHTAALEWLAEGYRQATLDGLKERIHHATSPVWVPDPYVAHTRWCSKCRRELDLHDDYHWVLPSRGRKGYYRSSCKECDADASYKRWLTQRTSTAPIQHHKRKDRHGSHAGGDVQELCRDSA